MKILSSNGLKGTIKIPGDKSISHRSLILSAIAEGETVIHGLLESDDVFATMECLQRLGVKITKIDECYVVSGVGLHGLKPPTEILDVRNAGTALRLMTGLLSAQPFTSTITGDRSIQSRPMDRVIQPLSKLTASFRGDHAPLVIHGKKLSSTSEIIEVKSAQVKSALLLAGLYTDLGITLLEEAPSRNHTELMMEAFSAKIIREEHQITLSPSPLISPGHIYVPRDISSAVFWLVAGSIVPNSEITMEDVGFNESRCMIVQLLTSMGANITISGEKYFGREKVATLTVKSSPLDALSPLEIDSKIVPQIIDEIPILAVAAAYSRIPMIVKGAGELKVKESNRISAIVRNLSKAGVHIIENEDGFEMIPSSKSFHGTTFDSYLDHRIAMSMAIFALRLQGESCVLHDDVIDVSYPLFYHHLKILEKSYEN